MANKKKKKVKSAFEVLDQRRNEEIAQMSKGSSNTAKKLNKILAPSSKEQISSGTIKTSNPTSISYATSNTRDISRQIIAPTSSMFSSTANELSSPVDLVKNMQEQQENERQKRKVEQLKKKVEQEKQKQGILTSTEMQDIVVNENFGSKKNYLPDNVKTEKTQLDKQREKATGQEIKKAIAPVSEIAKQNNKKLENYKKTSDTYKDYVLNQKQFNKYIDSNSRKWFNSGAFGDGYDFGDITKTILGTASDIQGDVITGAGRILEGTIDTGAWLLGKGAELTGNKKLADKTKNFIKKDFIEETGFNERASNSGTIGLINSLVNKDDNMFTAPVQLAKNLKKGDNFLASLKKSGTSSNYESNSFLGDKSDSLAESVGQLLGTVGLQAVGVPWWVTTGTTSFGGEAQNAFNEGATYNEAGTSALINAGAEILTEKLSGGISFGGKTLDKGLKNTLTKSISNETMKTLTKLGFDMTGEGAEEVLSSVISNVGKKLTYEDDETWNEMLLSKESMDEYLESFIGGAIMGGGFNVGKAVNSIKTGRDYDTGFSKNEQLIIDSEINNRLNALDKSKLTTKEKNKIKKEVQEDLKNGNLSIDTIESALAEKEYNKYKQEENKIKELKSQIKKLNSKKIVDLTVEDYENLNTQKKAIEEQISNLNNSTSKQELQTKMRNILSSDNGFIQKSYQEANLRNEKFTYETKDTDSDYRKTLTKEFEDKGNNSTKAHNQYEMLVKLSEDKGVQYHITNNKELSKLSNANKNINPSDIEGFVRTNKDGNKEILINIDSNRAINRIVGHETTHLFEGTKEYDELKDFAKQYATTKGEYDSRLKSTQELYKNVENTNIENEVTANIVGDYIFTDTDFINNLSTEKPNIFKRVYEEIKHLYKMATAGSKEEKQLLQLKKSFEKIYQKNEIQTDTKTKYHISKNLNNKIDEVLSDVTVRNPVKLRDFTPDILVQNGVKDLPMYENPSHIRKNILTENEAKKLGLSINKNDHYHGLGKELYIDAIDSLDNPRVIFKRNNSNNYLILTTLKDNNGNNIVVPIEIETTTNINRIKIDTNRIKSVYGYKTINNIDLNDYIKRNIKNSNFTKIYEQKKERGTGFSTAAGSFHKDNIPQSNKNVKSNTSSTKYSIQNNENDTQRTEKSSFSLDKKEDNKHLINSKTGDDTKYSISNKGTLQDSKGNDVKLETSDTGTLMAIHNLTAEKLKGIMELGGFPVPSIAIMNPNKTNLSYGDISVLFDRNTVDPSNKANEVYGSDVYSPRFPQTVQKVNEKALNKLNEDLGTRLYLEDTTLDETVQKNRYTKEFIDRFAKENNITVEDVYKDSDFNYSFSTDENVRNFITENDITFEKLLNDKQLRNEFYDLYRQSSQGILKGFTERKIETFEKAFADNNTNIGSRLDSDFNSIKNGSEKVLDKYATEKALRDKVLNEYEDQYNKFLTEKLASVFENKYIRNNKELFTPSGNRRSFNQLYNEYTLDNVVKEMKGRVRGEEGFFYGSGNIRSQVTPQFKSIADIKANESKLITNSQMENVKKDIDSDLNNLSETAKDFGGYSYDSYENALNEIAGLKKITSGEARSILEDYGFENVPDILVDKSIEFLEKLKNAPTEYFEAKPQRAVGLDEVQAIVIPNNTNTELKQQLLDKGLNVVEYDPNIEGDKQSKINQFDDLKFSLSNKNKQIAPSRNDIYGSDIKYQPKINRQLEEKKHKQIAPIVKENKVKVPVTKDMLPYIEMGKIVSGEASYKEVENFLNNTNGEKEPKLKKGTLAPVRTSNTKLQQIKDKAVEAVHWGQYLVTNRNEAIDRFSKQTGNKNIKFLADHLNNVQGEISTNINNAQIDNNGKKIGKSLVDIFVPAKKEKLSESFNDYLFHLSNIERHKNEKGSLVPLNESETLVKEYEKTYPQMKNWAKDVNTYNKNLLYKQAEAGLITKDTADYLSNKYKFYVPFIENIDGIRTNDTGKIITKSTVKSARGGSSKNLLGFEEAMIRQTQSAITQIRKNQLYNEIIETMPEKTIDFETNTNPNIFEGNLTTDKQNYLLSSYKDGKMQQAKISKELYRNLENKQEKALKELEAGLSFITKPLQKISNVRRNILTTWSPSFFITNPIKDLQDAPLNSKYAKDWSKNILKSFKELTTGKGEHLNEFLNMYGQGNLWGGENVDSGVYDVTKLAKTKNKVNAPSANNNKILKFSKKMIKKVPQINELMELAPRYAEYLASIENGATQMEALYNAREITTNFGRGGILTKFLNRNGFTFLNASTQGFSKLIRNFSGENGAKGVIGASAKVIALGVAPALFNALWFDDDDDYNDLPDYIKDNYYLLKTDDNDFVRIPKGRMISIFGSAARRTLERSKGKRNEMTLKEDFESYVKNAWNQVGVGSLESNNIYAPIKQVKTGKYGEAWYGGEIVPKRLQDKPDEEQYDSSIDKASIWIGKKLGISPYKVNYVIDQYSGGIGDMILPTITDEAQSDSNSVVGTMLAPLKDKFMANSITDNKNVSNFYTKSEELQKNANSKDATIKDHAVSGYMGIISKEMGALYQEMREVQENNDLSKSEKFKKALIIKDEINRLATEGMNGYNKVEMVSNYAIIGDREIYEKVNSKGEYYWDEPDDEDLYTLNSLGLTVSEKGTYYNAQQQIYSSWDEYDDYNESKKNALDYLINTSLPDKAKYQLYNNNYDKKQNINVAQTIGIDANTFLKYKQQNFEADKNKKGYPISGSRKRKVYNYLNKMNINYEDRLILAKLQGYKNDEDNVDIINYLDKMDITYEEYEQTLKELGFKIKNGYVRWD